MSDNTPIFKDLDHDALIKLVKVFVPNVASTMGVCNGFTSMWLQAFLIGDDAEAQFDERLDYLSTFFSFQEPAVLVENLNEMREERIPGKAYLSRSGECIVCTPAGIVKCPVSFDLDNTDFVALCGEREEAEYFKKCFDDACARGKNTIDDEKFNQMLRDIMAVEIAKTIQNEIQKVKNTQVIQEGLEKEIAQLDKEAQQKKLKEIRESLPSLTEEQKKMLDIQGFAEGIGMLQMPEKLEELFGTKYKQRSPELFSFTKSLRSEEVYSNLLFLNGKLDDMHLSKYFEGIREVLL